MAVGKRNESRDDDTPKPLQVRGEKEDSSNAGQHKPLEARRR